MRDAVIVSTARTPIGKAYRGAFNDTQAQELAGHAIGQAISRAGIAAEEQLQLPARDTRGADQGRAADLGPGHDRGQAVFVRADGACHCQ